MSYVRKGFWYHPAVFDAAEDTIVYAFSYLINEQVISRMPKHWKPNLCKGAHQIFPDLAALFDSSNTVTEDGMKCVDLSEVAKALEMSEEDVLKTFEGSQSGECLTSKDKLFQVQ